MGASAFQFEAFEGNTRVLTFNLRKYLQRAPWNVSAAAQILLECTDPSGVNIEPIQAEESAPGADWLNGVVVVTITPGDVTGAIGTWTACLTVYIGGEEITADEGTIEVLDRPGFPHP